MISRVTVALLGGIIDVVIYDGTVLGWDASFRWDFLGQMPINALEEVRFLLRGPLRRKRGWFPQPKPGKKVQVLRELELCDPSQIVQSHCAWLKSVVRVVNTLSYRFR
eukprot:6298980-Amphidinium_carterae.2